MSVLLDEPLDEDAPHLRFPGVGPVRGVQETAQGRRVREGRQRRRVPFPQGVDVVVMASNLPQYEPDLIRLVVVKAFEALVPGGEMHLIGETLLKIAAETGIGVLLVEQDMGMVESVANRCCVMDKGRIVDVLNRAQLADEDLIRSVLAL